MAIIMVQQNYIYLTHLRLLITVAISLWNYVIVAMATTTNMPEGDEDDTDLHSTFSDLFRV